MSLTLRARGMTAFMSCIQHSPEILASRLAHDNPLCFYALQCYVSLLFFIFSFFIILWKVYHTHYPSAAVWINCQLASVSRRAGWAHLCISLFPCHMFFALSDQLCPCQEVITIITATAFCCRCLVSIGNFYSSLPATPLPPPLFLLFLQKKKKGGRE